MRHEFSSTFRALLRNAAGSAYHIAIVALSGGIALLLPAGARHFLSFWSQVEHNKLSLIAIEMTVAVLDIGLPGIDGFEVVRRLRARGSNLPVLLLTMFAQKQIVAGLTAGAVKGG